MVFQGHVHNGVVVLDEPQALPDGATVRIEIICRTDANAPRPPRVGGQWKGQVHIAEDFDELPDDLAEALGAKVP